jgi:membrane fusion protein (multidrug efflux system)
LVQVLELVGTNVARSTELIGQLEAPQSVQVRARVEGIVQRVAFVEGRPVREADLLFQLDPRPYEERLAAAMGALAEARAALNKYERDVARLVPLAEKRAIPAQDLDNARASVEVGKAGVQSAQARVESATLDLEYCEVRAPISGWIGARAVSAGALVGKGEPTLMATISGLDPIWFHGAVSEVQYLRAEQAARLLGRRVLDLGVSLILADGTVHGSRGRFVFIEPTVDSRTGTLRVRVEFANPDALLRPGMFGRARVDLGVREGVLVVPERAVVEMQGRRWVWVVGVDRQARRREVELGDLAAGGWVVEGGLEVGERVVVEGVQRVREGMVVQAVTGPPATAAGVGGGVGGVNAAGK